MKSLKFVSGQDESNISHTARMLESPKYTKILKDFILHAKLGFSDIRSEKVKWKDKGVPKHFLNISNRQRILLSAKRTRYLMKKINLRV